MKKIFTGNVDFNKSAFLNWRTSSNESIGNLIVLAEGFLDSAIELTKSCLLDNQDKKADSLIFAILHNANHGIELDLKSLLWTLNELQDTGRRIEGKHDIRQLFNTARANIKKYKDNSWQRKFDEKNKQLAAYIDELYSLLSGYGKGDNMDFSRYPITHKYESHFYIDQLNNIEIDLENLNIVLEEIKTGLDERASYFSIMN